MATTALASNVDVLMGFPGNGVMLTIKGTADHVAASGFPLLKDLLKTYIEAGGKMYVCGPCVGSRTIAQRGINPILALRFTRQSKTRPQSLVRPRIAQ